MTTRSQVECDSVASTGAHKRVDPILFGRLSIGSSGGLAGMANLFCWWEIKAPVFGNGEMRSAAWE